MLIVTSQQHSYKLNGKRIASYITCIAAEAITEEFDNTARL